MIRWPCWRLRARLVDFAEGILLPPDRRRVERHLDGCAHCTDAVTALQAIPARIRAHPPAVPDDAFFRRQHDAIMRTVRAEAAARQTAPARWQWMVAPAFAVTTAVVLMLAIWRAPPAVIPTPPLEALDSETLLNVADVTRSFVPDGQFATDTSWQPGHDLSEVDDQDLTVLEDLVGGDT